MPARAGLAAALPEPGVSPAWPHWRRPRGLPPPCPPLPSPCARRAGGWFLRLPLAVTRPLPRRAWFCSSLLAAPLRRRPSSHGSGRRAVCCDGLVDDAVGLAAERSRQSLCLLLGLFLIADDGDQRRSADLLLVVELRDGGEQPVEGVFQLQSDEHFGLLRSLGRPLGAHGRLPLRRRIKSPPATAAVRAGATGRARSVRA